MDLITEPESWIALGEELLPDMIALRRAIHEEPELGLHLPLTTAKAKAALAGLPLDIVDSTSTTGFMAILRGPANGRTVLLRGDMDALPMNEDTGLEFSSQTPGAMHACGHDTHVAMLVGAARALCNRKDQLSGTVIFMFQPGEEGHHGARYMIEDGLLDPLPDAAFALHITPNVPTGIFSGRAGALLAAADRFEVVVTGQGGHASAPHASLDPVPIACEIVMAIQAMVTRTINAFDPAVVTVGRIEAGTTNNVIPERAILEGTIRSFSERTRKTVHANLERLVPAIALAHGATAIIDIDPGFPVTVCTEPAVNLAERVAQSLFGPQAWRTMPTPAMGAEDFAYVLQKVPGAMAFLGATPEGGDWRSCCALHSNRMVLDEAVMARGVAMHCAYAEAYLAGGFEG